MPGRKKNKEITFSDYPEFRPNLTPKEMFSAGSFGGTYWRPISSSVTGKRYSNQHLKYPESWWSGLPDNFLVTKWEDYDKSINTYNVKVGTTLEFWESKDWIDASHPYGWVQWYCDFYLGERSHDDERQIKRWLQTAGPKSRFRRQLINMIKQKKTTYDDVKVSPKIRQTLQHWGYRLTEEDLL
tara:strand:- start:2678 stop:3229 length:552 start_codon:yes stop_codon:yes gene_type:complete